MLKPSMKIETKMHLEKLNNNKKYNFETLGQKSDQMLDYMSDFRPNIKMRCLIERDTVNE